MNPEISRLYHISKKKNRIIIGLMSGTSLDGLDIALCKISDSGHNTQLELLKFTTKSYDSIFRGHVRSIFAQRHIDQQALCGLNAHIGLIHAELINSTLREWSIRPEEVDLIASHGQTVYHAPRSLTQDDRLPNSTLQIGDGDHIAFKTGIITVSDFRQKHIAAGGEGAPLAAYGDYLLYTHHLENRILLNIGGISNFTFLPRYDSSLQAFATDIGPGNTLMNQYMLQYLDQEMDTNGDTAAMGTVQYDLLDLLMDDFFLKSDFPKTTGPELFNLHYLSNKAAAIRRTIHPNDMMATLNAFSAKAITDGIVKIADKLDNMALYVSGGGIHNPILMENIRKGLTHNIKIESMTSLGMDPDAKEACLFALLANETVAGQAAHVNNLKDSPMICMGKISLPT